MASQSQRIRPSCCLRTYLVAALICLASLPQVSGFSAKLNAPWGPNSDPPSFRESTLSKYQRRNNGRSRSRRGALKDSESETAETALLDEEAEDDAILEDDTIAMVDFDGDFPNESSTLLAAQEADIPSCQLGLFSGMLRDLNLGSATRCTSASRLGRTPGS